MLVPIRIALIIGALGVYALGAVITREESKQVSIRARACW
jgi:hypothetical protein